MRWAYKQFGGGYKWPGASANNHDDLYGDDGDDDDDDDDDDDEEDAAEWMSGYGWKVAYAHASGRHPKGLNRGGKLGWYLVCLNFGASVVFGLGGGGGGGGGVVSGGGAVRATTDLEVFTATALLVVGALLWMYALCEGFRCLASLSKWSDRHGNMMDELNFIMEDANLKVGIQDDQESGPNWFRPIH